MLPNSKSSSSSQMTGELDNMGILSGSHLGKAGPFLAALEQQLYQSIVPRRLNNEPSGPVDEAISMALQQQQTVDSDEDDDGEGSVWSNYFQVPYEADGPRHEKEAEKRESEEESSPAAVQRRKSVAEAFWFLRDFVEARWPVQLQTGYIKIQCDITMDEVKELGRLNKAEGTKECRKLISVPVIHDEIGYALWLELSREMAAHGDATGQDTQAIKAKPVSTGLTTTKTMAPSTAMSKTTEEDIATRRARSMRRRATDGDTMTVQSAPRTASTHVATTSRTRRKSDLELVRPHQVICTTCGSRAVPRPKSDDGAVSDDEYEDEQEEDGEEKEEEEEDGLKFKDRKRGSISRRLSVKMNKTLTKFGEGLATGYGGNGGNRVTGQPSG